MTLEVSESIVSYLRNVDTTFRNDFGLDETKHLFLDNVFREIAGSELKLMLKKSTSVILENFIASISIENLFQLFKVCQVGLDEILCSTSGCHILKKCFRRLVVLLDKSDNIETSSWIQTIDIVQNLCNFSKNENDLILWLTESSQTFQCLIATLGGSNAISSSKKNKSPESKNSTTDEITIPKRKVPPKFVEAFENIVSSFVELKIMKVVELLNHDKAAPCICCLIKVASLRSPSSLERLCSKLLSSCQKNESDNWNTLIILTKDRIASHVVDSLLESNHKATSLKLMNILAAKERLVELACHAVANFVVQKLIVKSVSQNQFESIFTALIDGLEDVLAAEKYGVVQKLAEQCVHVKSCQKPFMDALLQTFHCCREEESKLIVSLIASYTTYDLFMNANDKKIPPLSILTYHGSLLLQTLFQFDEPLIITDSLNNLSSEHILKITCHSSGSHIIDSFFNSATVKESTKMKFIKNYREHFHTFARDKYGNKVLWNMWTRCSINMKVAVAESLVNYEDLKSHHYGKYVLIHFRLRDFVEKRENWNKFQTQQLKKRKVFDEFLNADAKTLKAKKKRC